MKKHNYNFPWIPLIPRFLWNRTSPKQYKEITVYWCKQPTSKSFQMCLWCIYLLKLYYKSVIILLTNNLTNIWSEISKIRQILWMVYTCNVKGLEDVEKLGRNGCTLHRWPRSLEMSNYIGPYKCVWRHLLGSKPTNYGLNHREWSSASGTTRDKSQISRKR